MAACSGHCRELRQIQTSRGCDVDHQQVLAREVER